MTHLYLGSIPATISWFDPFRWFVFILQRLTLIDIHAPSFIHFRRQKVFQPCATPSENLIDFSRRKISSYFEFGGITKANIEPTPP